MTRQAVHASSEWLGRVGIVLPAVLVALVAMTVLVHALFVVSRSQLRVARIGRDLVVLDRMADVALARASSDLPDSIAHGMTGPEVAWASGAASTAWTLLSEEVVLATARAVGRVSPVPVERGRLVWRLDPVVRIAEIGAGVRARGVDSRGTLVVDWLGEAAGPGCTEIAHRLGSPRTGFSRVTDPAWRPELGLLRVEDLWRLRDADVPNVASLENEWPLLGAAESAVISGVTLQGLLAARSDVQFLSGARFRGIVLAEGEVVVGPESLIEGVIVAERVQIDSAAVVVASACSAVEALAANQPRLPTVALDSGAFPLGPASRE